MASPVWSLIVVMNSQLVIEALADIQHDIGSHWMRYLFSVCTTNEDGSCTIPADMTGRWKRQMETEYQRLSESEKDSDREQAAKVLDVLLEFQAANMMADEGLEEHGV